VLASGVNLPPQKIAFPFSLIRPAAEPIPGAPPGAHVLVPGWVLAENPYALQRCALKFRARDRATRQRLEHDAYRPDLAALVADALRRLERPGEIRDVYTDRDIPGLGRNVLHERHRAAAVRWYADHLERLESLRLLDRAVRGVVADPESLPARAAEAGEYGAWDWLARLPDLMEAFGAAVERSKARDEDRGLMVLDDYATTHPPTGVDPIVRHTWEQVRSTQEQVAQVLAAVGHPLSRTRRTREAAPLA
jgi:hypothetical protein